MPRAMHDSGLSAELESARREAKQVYAAGGEVVGEVDAVYSDVATGTPNWLRVRSGDRRALVPVEGIDVDESGVRSSYTSETIAASPAVAGDEIRLDAERALRDHYGLAFRHHDPDTSDDRTEILPGRDDRVTSMLRLEEELLVSKRPVEIGKVRLHKWVEAEPVTVQVELQRETVRIVREPIERPAPHATLGAEEIEVPLYAERPELDKETVARERIVLQKDIETGVETIAEELRVERVDVDETDVRQ